MKIRGLASSRGAHLALAMLVCAVLSACGPGKTSSATSASATSTASGTSAASSAKSVTLSWSAPTQNSDGSSLTNLAGYTLHYGTSSQDYTGSIQITSPSATSYVVSDGNFPAGTYYFAISAYNAQQLSSPLSSEITVTLD
jgi:hypothetical protein